MEHGRSLDSAVRLQEVCLERTISVAVAESLTAGLIGATLASVSGASAYFRGGIICYSAALKQSLLQVPAEVIERDGVVSQSCVEAMARGAQRVCDARAAIAVSGEAGPLASSAEPVGTVWIACAFDEQVVSRCEHFAGDRASIRVQTVDVAISLLTDTILSHPSGTL